jgi:threonylcarbamoyladenosine tRNA methylthiotransferase MtaB
MRIAILTLGCKTNQAESFGLEDSLKRAGNEIVDVSDAPHLCIINTCTVTAKADRQSRQLIYRALRNDAKVVVTGCYSELNADEIKHMDHRIDVVRNAEKKGILGAIIGSDKLDSLTFSHYSRHRPIVKVQDGCNFSCSYCTIPRARGKSKSEPQAEIISRIKECVSAGYKEVVLTGIHLGTYGHDLSPRISLHVLLSRILQETDIPRLRLSSLEINEIDEELLEVMADSRLCRHLHIPLQSGDDSVLSKMGRMYSTSDFRNKVDLVSKTFPDIAIGTDVITGFPGENEEMFKNTCQFIEKAPFSYIHVFPYSPRPGTRAASFNDQIPEAIKKRRVNILKKIGDIKRNDYLDKHVGRSLEMIVENKTFEGYLGTSANYIKVLLAEKFDVLPETLIDIRVTGYSDFRALGIPVNDPKPINP